MDFMCSNFRQINDNVVTVKSDVSCATNFSDMQNNFSYFSRFERGTNSSGPLVNNIINPSDQVVTENSSQTSNWTT